MGHAAIDAGHGTTCDGCLMLAVVERADRAEAKLLATWAVLDRANALNPNDFKTGQSHLSPAFREVDFREAFRTVLDLLNDIETASGYATRPLPPMNLTYLGHDDSLDLDLLLSVWEDGTVELATRPGRDERWVTWSAPVVLRPEFVDALAESLGAEPGWPTS